MPRRQPPAAPPDRRPADLRRARRRSVWAAALVLALAAFVAARFQLSADITHLLPSAEDQRLAALARQLADSPLSRSMVLSVEAATPAQARAAAKRLAAKLRADPEVAWLLSGPDEAMGKAFYDLYYPHRLGLLSEVPERELAAEVATGRLSDAGLDRAVADLKRQLGLPGAALIKRVAPGDPLLSFPAWLKQLEAARPANLTVEDGQFMGATEQHAVLLLGTRHSALSFAHQAPFLGRVEAEFAAVQREIGGEKASGAGGGGAGAGAHSLRLRKTGIHRHAVAARRRIERDVQRISVVSTVAIVLLFIVLFRSVGLLALGLIPLAVGVLAGLGVTLARSGQVHGLTLTFGATLIGVCLDYPIHLFNHHTLDADVPTPLASLRRVWPGLALGAVTTVTGFAGLAASDLPAIREVAIFASVGILAALLATRYLVAPWLPAAPANSVGPLTVQRRAAAGLAASLAALARHRIRLWLVLLVALVVGAAGLPGLRWSDDVKALTRQEPALAAEDDAVRAEVSAHESGRVIVVTAPTLELALQRNDALALKLQKARKNGVLGGFRSLHSLLWSADLQRRNLAQLAAAQAATPSLATRMNAALTKAGFRPALFAPFAAALAAAVAKPTPPLTWRDLLASPLADLARPFRVDLAPTSGAPDGEVGILTFVRDVPDPAALRAVVAEVPGGLFFDQRAFMEETFGSHRRGALLLVLFGLLAVVGVVALRYRALRPTLLATAPALLAGLFTVGLLALLGETLTLLHLVSLVLVLSMGVDYGVFLAEGVVAGGAGASPTSAPERQGATLLSIVIACLSTVLGFGLLAMSTNPALRAIGLTTGIGVLASLALAPTVLLLVAPPRSSLTHSAED